MLKLVCISDVLHKTTLTPPIGKSQSKLFNFFSWLNGIKNPLLVYLNK